MGNQFSDKRNLQWSGPLLIVRDVLIFSMCILSIVLIRLMISQTDDSITSGVIDTASNISLQSKVDENSSAVPADITETSSDLGMNTSAGTTIPSPTPDAAISRGDFSSLFPTIDTGISAYKSFQSDTLKIAINKIEDNGTTYFLADVWVKNINAFHTALAKGTYGRGYHEMPLKIANENQAIFAVSSDYYGAREHGVVVRNGILYRDVMSDDVCILKIDGSLSVYDKNSFSALEMLDDTVWQAWAFGPALVKDGAACDTSSSKIKVKNPRSAIGYYEPGHYCFIVVDGRQSGYSAGMTLDELANTFESLGCKTAYNLDGGATAMMVFQGAVISQPTNGGRSSSDIIYF